MPPLALEFFTPSQVPLTVKLPLLGYRIAAGFPSPADDYLENRIDVNHLLIDNPPATFIVRVAGESMKGAGILDGDFVVVNRAAEWSDGSIVVAIIAQEFTLKRIKKQGRRVFLVPENRDYPPLEVTADSDCEVWGVVTGSFRQYRR